MPEDHTEKNGGAAAETGNEPGHRGRNAGVGSEAADFITANSIAANSTAASPIQGITFSGISKVFPDGTHALDDVSFSVSQGEFFTVVGPSGCGKSTLLRIASSLEDATEGHVEVDRERLGYIFQDSTLMPWRTVQKNVELIGELHRIPKAERNKLAAEAIRTVGLEGFEKHYPNALSGGMKMRVSIARSLTMNPAVFMFDEPFGALDEITRERLNEETLRLFREEQFAGLFITHSIPEAVFLSTRVGVMSPRPGRIVDTFDIPFEYPRSPELRFEADFAELAGAVSASLRASGGADVEMTAPDRSNIESHM